jgi:hypothetical protein
MDVFRIISVSKLKIEKIIWEEFLFFAAALEERQTFPGEIKSGTAEFCGAMFSFLVERITGSHLPSPPPHQRESPCRR